MKEQDIDIKSEPMNDAESTHSEITDNIPPNDHFEHEESEISPEQLDPTDFVDDEKDLIEKRQLITHLLNTSEGKEGDYWILIPEKFLSEFLNSPQTSFEQLKHSLGPVNSELLVDSNRLLHVKETEDTQSVCIHPTVFEHLADWFGAEGKPILRALIVDENGNKIVEKYPPYFVVHTLGKSNKSHSLNLQKSQGFILSSISTFRDLIEKLRSQFFKNLKTDIRVWFLNGEKLDDLSGSITIQDFLEIPVKSVVLPNILDDTLGHHQICSLKYHILVEAQDKSLSFPITQYINNFDMLALDYESSLCSGGDLGLINLGNTCYMNSALQCLVHVPEINYYFFFNIFLKELNKSNPLGYNGNMAQAFGSLLHKLFNDTPMNGGSSLSSISPREFKYTIGHFSSMFQGYQQQDSQEFLSWLLDALHEDLNRIYDKPYLEKPELKDDEIDDAQAIKQLANTSWEQYKKRNDSVIVDLFAGLYQSILVCPDCGKTSITYDPFNDLTLPLPIDKKWYHTFTVVNLDFSQNLGKRIKSLEVELNKTSTFEDLLNYLTNFLKVPKEFLFLYEIFNDYVYQDFQSNNKKYKFIPISELISSSDKIVIYIIPHTDSDMIVPVFNVLADKDRSYNITNVFAVPLFITVGEQDINSFGKIRGKLEQVAQVLTTTDITAHYRQIKSVHKQYYSKSDFEIEPAQSSDELDGYNSDVSLADPEISADYGFTIKFFENARHQEDPRKKIQFPHIKPNLSGLPKLADKLPDLKYNYYHYPSFQKDTEYVLVKPLDKDSLPSLEQDVAECQQEGVRSPEVDVKSTGDSEPIDSSSETSENDRLGLLFDSVRTLNKGPQEDFNYDLEKHNHPTLVKKNILLVCEWDHEIHEQLFDSNKTWEVLEEIPNPELQSNRAKLIAKQKSTISLYDCLDKFYQPEVLGDQDLWFCPRCKDHKQATKTIKIWQTGDILTIHLKRFQVARSFSDKIDVTVDFPIEGLEMSRYVNNSDEELIYDLIAVDNHYGGLGGGHYTASALNFRDKQWYYYNDGRVTKIEDPKETISGAAYLLFYRKRSKSSLGGEKLNALIEQGRQEFANSLDHQRVIFEHVKEQTDLYSQYDDKKEESEETLTDMEVESLSGGKKSRSPLMDDESTDNKKRLLSKDKLSSESD